MRIAIFGTTYDNIYNRYLLEIIDYLKSNSVDIVLESDFFSFVADKCELQNENFSVEKVADIQADMAISFGGDGTFLVTAQAVAKKNIPILGINAGHLGFLADVSVENIKSALDAVLAGNYRKICRTMLSAKRLDGVATEFLSLNELSILWDKEVSMISIDVWIDNDFVATYKADGLLISTPTGSTAYSLSVGGPILSPNSQSVLIVPIAPHSLTVRPLVVPDSSIIHIKAHTPNSTYQLSSDGYSVSLDTNIEIEIKKSELSVCSVQPIGNSFFSTIRHKLMWGADIRDERLKKNF